MGVNADGRRELLGLKVGDSESEPFWREFLASLKQRGLSGVRLVVSDAHVGLTKAVGRMFQGCSWQRCRVHFARNLLQTVPKAQQFPAPIGVHPHGHDNGAGADLQRLAQPPVQVGGIEVEVRVAAAVERPLQEGLDLGIEALADAAHLRAGDAGIRADRGYQGINLVPPARWPTAR
jgi:hypothetical protein